MSRFKTKIRNTIRGDDKGESHNVTSSLSRGPIQDIQVLGLYDWDTLNGVIGHTLVMMEQHTECVKSSYV